MTARRERRGRGFRILLGALLVYVTAQVGLIVFHNRGLKSSIESELRVGDIVAPLELSSLAGELTRIGYDDAATETVLLVFAPDCPACRHNVDDWKTLRTEVSSKTRRFYFVSAAAEGATRVFADRYELGESVLFGSTEELATLKIGRIPATVVVEPGGRVRQVWIGAVPAGAFDS